jgi:hypothetical protein
MLEFSKKFCREEVKKGSVWLLRATIANTAPQYFLVDAKIKK